jgi:hypothetical protein
LATPPDDSIIATSAPTSGEGLADGSGGVDCPALAAASVADVVKAHFAEYFDETTCLIVRGKVVCVSRGENPSAPI